MFSSIFLTEKKLYNKATNAMIFPCLEWRGERRILFIRQSSREEEVSWYFKCESYYENVFFVRYVAAPNINEHKVLLSSYTHTATVFACPSNQMYREKKTFFFRFVFIPSLGRFYIFHVFLKFYSHCRILYCGELWADAIRWFAKIGRTKPRTTCAQN